LDPALYDSEPPASPVFWESRPKFQDRVWVHVVLLLATILTTTLAGLEHYLAFQSDFLPLRNLTF